MRQIYNLYFYIFGFSNHFRREKTGKPKGTIARRELPSLPKELTYRCQEKAWFDEQVMVDWVDEILTPYVANVPRGIVPIILLDDFTVHKTGRVVGMIQRLGVEVEFIPPGCTGMVQPVDVGYNKSLKANVRKQYREWMFSQDTNMIIPCPSRQQVSEWIIGAMADISDVTVRNAWRKSGFSYFPEEPKE